eukprot:GHRR01023573.1.p1 GENE.GHRR01023573.1~~GHRR01023573.1.p1  ORF type:complete len:189 (-),score=23.70 GHRR01023573.1:181-747(-)
MQLKLRLECSYVSMHSILLASSVYTTPINFPACWHGSWLATVKSLTVQELPPLMHTTCRHAIPHQVYIPLLLLLLPAGISPVAPSSDFCQGTAPEYTLGAQYFSSSAMPGQRLGCGGPTAKGSLRAFLASRGPEQLYGSVWKAATVAASPACAPVAPGGTGVPRNLNTAAGNLTAALCSCSKRCCLRV